MTRWRSRAAVEVRALEAELASVRAEQKRLAQAVALSDEVPELVVELTQRSARIQNLEAQLIAARRTPAELAALIDRVEANVRPTSPSFAKRWATKLIAARSSRRCSPTV
jgi:chromosome segregation ATPase